MIEVGGDTQGIVDGERKGECVRIRWSEKGNYIGFLSQFFEDTTFELKVLDQDGLWTEWQQLKSSTQMVRRSVTAE